MLAWLMMVLLIVVAVAYELRQYGYEGIGPPLIGAAIGLTFFYWKRRQR